LSDVDAILSSALDRNGYVEKSYWGVPRGFALATKLEQIEPDRKSKLPPARWSTDVPRLVGKFSLGDYLRALFTANPGYYRLIVFVVTDVLFSESSRSITEAEAQGWLTGGLNALPPGIGLQPYDPGVICTALVYEFERRATGAPILLTPSPVGAGTHLTQSGLWKALGGP
jgi:hypothetical protein